MISHQLKTLFAIAFLVLLVPAIAVAQSGAEVDIIPASDANNVDYDESGNTHTPLKLSPDKSEIIELDEDAGSVIIGNPTHFNIMTDTTRRLVVIPRQSGASHFIVLGREGQVIMQRHVLVASPQKNYVRIRRNCAGASGESCIPTSIYYCPDMCHEIALPEGAPDTAENNDALTQSGSNMGAAIEQDMPPNATPE